MILFGPLMYVVEIGLDVVLCCVDVGVGGGGCNVISVRDDVWCLGLRC